LTIKATDNDKKSPMTLEQQIVINVIAQKFQAIFNTNETTTNVFIGEPPTIIKSFINHGGLSSIVFSQKIVLPQIFYNLTSENEGPSFFNVTLIINEENIKQRELELDIANSKLLIA
jgi:hypothetical protein